jgi:hypothetical protein
MEDLANLKNRLVHFKLRDIFVPPPQEVLEELHSEDILQGRVVGFTERGSAEGTYAVVEVDGLRNAVVIPIGQILGVT